MNPREKQRRTRWIEQQDTEAEKVDTEIGALNKLRYYHRKYYDRLRDKILFGQTIEGSSTTKLQARVDQEGLDPRIGYLAIVADFIPFVGAAKDDLELKPFRKDLKRKIAARRKMRAAQ